MQFGRAVCRSPSEASLSVSDSKEMYVLYRIINIIMRDHHTRLAARIKTHVYVAGCCVPEGPA